MSEIIERINTLRRRRNALILAHVYQPGEIQDIADYVGDSLGLAHFATKSDAGVVVLAGVRFMAESVKLLNPDKTVLLPAGGAGCPMADMIDIPGLDELKQKHPGAKVVCYVNSSAEIKAASDICCTSSNALRVIESIPESDKIIFIPDQHLGDYLAQKSGREIILPDGYCYVHQDFRPEDAARLRALYPDAPLLAHPECSRELRACADFIGSTTEIIEYCRKPEHAAFLIATEKGVFHQLRRIRPDAVFVSLSEHGGICHKMKMTTLDLIARSLEENTEEICIPEEFVLPARAALQRMMAY